MFSSHKSIAIICNAPLVPSSQLKEKISKYPVLVAADGGANHCLGMGLKPDIIVGDFDSIDPSALEAFQEVPQKRYPSNKDETDLELALSLAFHPNIEKITIFGALGGRTDHTIGNLVLLSRYPGKVFLESESELLFVIDKQTELSTKVGQEISLIPLNGPVKGIASEGLKWPLKDKILDKSFIGLCNQATASKVTLSVKEGDLLCCINQF